MILSETAKHNNIIQWDNDTIDGCLVNITVQSSAFLHLSALFEKSLYNFQIVPALLFPVSYT